MDLTDENRIREIVKEEIANFSPPKKKRAPNKWQQFLKECAKNQSADLSYTDKVKECSVIYKKNKENKKNDISSINNETNINNDTQIQGQENQ